MASRCSLLPTVAYTDRHRHDGTTVTRRTLILPGRPIILIAVIVLPSAIATAVTQPERTRSLSNLEQPQLRPQASSSLPVDQLSMRNLATTQPSPILA